MSDLEFDRRLMPVKGPWQPSRLVAHTYMLRGAILSSFSYVEICLAELAIRSTYVEEYAAISSQYKTLQFNTSKRITYLRRIAEVRGPLAPFRPLIQAACDRWESLQDLRGRMAHGHFTALSNAPISFYEIKVNGGDTWSSSVPYYPGDLETAAMRVARFGRACQRIRDRLSGSDILPTIAEEAARRIEQPGPILD